MPCGKSAQLAQLVDCRSVNPEVAGSNHALVNLSLFIKKNYKNVPSQFSLWFITWCPYSVYFQM